MPEPCSTARILVGDDEIQICRLVRDVLRSSGYTVDIARNGHDLLQQAQSGRYSLLVLDTLFVELSGLEVVMNLRDRGDGVPILLMYGPRKEADRMESFAFTYRVDLLRKPFGVADLRAAVRGALRDARPD